MEDAGGDTEETEDSEETEDIRGLFSGVTSPSVSTRDFLFCGSGGTLGSEATFLFSSAGFVAVSGPSFNSTVVSGGGPLFTGDLGSSALSSLTSL